MAARLTNFEIYGDDPEALAAFYRALFGWPIERVEGVDYWRIPIDAAAPALAGGGLTRPPAFGHTGWMNFFQVDSVDDALALTPRLGGRVLKEKTAVPRTAWHAVIADPAGNAFLIWEPDPLAFPLPEAD
ncbi:VOC family protein [Ancylobacter terrae]|uniref:VOC family protein n=1 Tax=Ancylobacter sp. sgz301288 TaxID=3342077 RepID=UPI00385C3010